MLQECLWAATSRNVPWDICAKWRFKSTEHPRSLISLHFPYVDTLHPCLSKMRPAKILIRLRECAVWSESALSAYFWTLRFLCCHAVCEQRRPRPACVSILSSQGFRCSLIAFQKGKTVFVWKSKRRTRTVGSVAARTWDTVRLPTHRVDYPRFRLSIMIPADKTIIHAAKTIREVTKL